MRNVVKTIKERCGQCYSCVRNCPVKAVKISNGQAEVIQERCIQCGNCVKICARHAKSVMSGIEHTKELVQKGAVAAILAPSFPAALPYSSGELIGRLKQLGFQEVWEVAVGAELVAQEYQSLNMDKGPFISSACPAVVNLVELHYPRLIPYLVPVVSPALATAKLIRQREKDISIVFIGPCIAKKGELVNGKGLIDEVMTFEELKCWMDEYQGEWKVEDKNEFDSPTASLAYLFPLRGGMLKNLFHSENILENEYVVAEGPTECKEILQALMEGSENIRFVDALFCKGCIDGPGIVSDDKLITRKSRLLRYFRQVPASRQVEGKKQLLKVQLDLSRRFTDRSTRLPVPGEEDIRKILWETDKFSPEDELNCGACGYSSCREKAIAVFQGIAEKEMCLPYLLAQKNLLLSAYQKELQNIKELNNDLDIIIESSYDGIVMSNNKGKVERVNQALAKMLGMDPGELAGKSMEELEQRRVLYPSATLMVLKEKKPLTFIQSLSNGKQVLATGTPVFDEKGRIYKVICNIRDFEELQRIKRELDDNRGLVAGGYISDRGAPQDVIALSEEFSSVLEMARRVATVDSTVLITGESGVGKEVIARYIHSSSPRKDGPFIKINCGALPESLIESELFGYEMGAFTGAKREGKPGLFELAHNGTILLDEIGELPFSQQVKLLQVLQEKRITRIGGTQSIDVDVRVIAATNRDLAVMVKEGRFRSDLYYRLHVVPIRIPALRERQDDIIPLMYHFLDKWNQKYGTHKFVSSEVKNIFLHYSWPGNVRELENLMERLVVTAREDVIVPDDLPSGMVGTAKKEDASLVVKEILPLRKAIEEVERQIILQARKRYHSTYEIAEVLEVNQSTIVRKLKKYDEQG